MTRLVGVRAVCDACSAAAAVVFCVAHRSVMCRACDRLRHPAPVSPSHQRVDLGSAVTALPFCEHCDDAPATTYCDTEGITLCDKCDGVVHASQPLSHFRTPISSTLRDRGVEFRARSRPRPPDSPDQTASNSKVHSNQQSLPKRLAAKQLQPGLSAVSSPTPGSVSRQANTGSASKRVVRRRSSKVLAKRKYRRDGKKGPDQPTKANATDCVQTTPPQRGPDFVDSDDYPSFLFPYSSAVTFQEDPSGSRAQSRSLSDPLSDDLDERLHQEGNSQEGFTAEASEHVQGLGNIVTYGSIDLGGDSMMDGITSTGKDANAEAFTSNGASMRRKEPGFDASSSRAEVVNNDAVQGRQQTRQNVAALAAAAAAAAGEMYLLNSASSRSGSPGERLSPPLLEAGQCPDPAGVTEAARAAAESAVAAVDRGHAAVGKGGVAPGPQLPPQATPMTIDGFNEFDGRHTQAGRRMCGVIRGGAEGLSKKSEAQWEGDMFEEEVRRLDIETGAGRGMRVGSKWEGGLKRPQQGSMTNRIDGSTDLLAMGDAERGEVLAGGSGLDDLEMERDEFGDFDSIGELGQLGGSLGFQLTGYRSRQMDSD